MSAIDQLLTLARAYGLAAGIKASTVSWRVFGDSKKLADIEAGADIQVRRQERAMRWFAENWPSGAEWPSDVPRPHPSTPSEREGVS